MALQLNGAPSDPALGTQHGFMSRGRDGKYLLLSMYRDSNELMVRNWHCVYCKHRWRKN